MQETTKCKVHTPLLKATLHNRQVNGGLSFIMGKFVDLTGKRFNRLIVVGLKNKKNGQYYWECLCDCGNKKIIRSADLNNNHASSCGCYGKEKWLNGVFKHGKSNCHLYYVWKGMKDRCYNKKHKSYKHYGGRGIIMCDEWKNSFNSFYDWAMNNGYVEDLLGSGRNYLTIDRINVNGNYEPLNCRWATYKEQQNNRRNNYCIFYGGKYKTLQQLAEEYNISCKFIKTKLKQGISIEEVLKLKPKKPKLYDYKGEKLNVVELSKISGLSYECIRARIKYGWDIEKVVEYPLENHKK